MCACLRAYMCVCAYACVCVCVCVCVDVGVRVCVGGGGEGGGGGVWRVYNDCLCVSICLQCLEECNVSELMWLSRLH